MALQFPLQLYSGLLKNISGATAAVPGIPAWTKDSQELFVSNGLTYVRPAPSNQIWIMPQTSPPSKGGLRTLVQAAGGLTLVGDFILDEVSGTTYLLNAYANKVWTPATTYALGDTIIDYNGNLQTVIDAGISGGVEPTWSTNFTTVDNGVIWMVGAGFVPIAGSGTVGTVSSVNNIYPVAGNVTLYLHNLPDVAIVTSPPTTAGQVLTFNGSVWVAETPVGTLANLSDVSITSPPTTSGQVLTYNGSVWIADTPTLAGLRDVSFTSPPTSGQLLSFNGTKWVNTAAPVSGINQLTGDVLASGTGIVVATIVEYVNAQTNTTYTIQTADRNHFTTFENALPIAVILPQAGASFPDGWFADYSNIGIGTVTITATTSLIDGLTQITLVQYQGIRIVSDGTNYFTIQGRGAAGGNTPQSANLVLAGPASGFAALPSFRSLVAADLPPAQSATLGAVVPDNTTTSVSGLTGIISAIVGGSAIDQLNGDVTTPANSTGNTTATLATVNSNVGTYSFAHITVNAKGLITAASTGTPGTVNSVGLSMPGEFSVANSPVTSSGTLTVSKTNQSANRVYAGPTTGSAAAPAFRTLVGADIPIALAPISSPPTPGVLGGVIPDGDTISIDAYGVISAIAGTTGISQLTGDVTAGPGSGSQVATLASTGVTPGSYSFTNLTVDAKGRITSASSGSIGGGTVTSVDMAVPSGFTVSGNPVTTFGTITIGLSSQSAHAVWAGPTSGSAVPTFRSLVAGDLPTATGSSLGIVQPDNTTISISSGVISVAGGSLGITQLTGDVTAGPGSGSQAASVVNVNGAAIPLSAAFVATNSSRQFIATSAVTSVALSAPAEFVVSGSPITGTGTLTLTKATQVANVIYAGPTSGTAAAPTFRNLVSADIPLATNSLVGGVVPDGTTTTVSGGVISAISGAAGINQLTGDVLAGPSVGSTSAALSTTGVTAGSYGAVNITVDAKGRLTSAKSSATAIFYLSSGAVANPAAWALAPRSSNVITQCKVYVVSSDPSVALTFDIYQNGSPIFTSAITIAAGTSSGTVSTFTSLGSSPLPVIQDDKFTLVITSGTSSWSGTIQLE